MFTFLHAADLQLDSPVTTVGGRGMTEGAIEVLREASLHAWDALVDAAIAHAVDFVVLAGGIYEGPDRGLRAQLRLRDGLARLDAAGIRAFVVLGEHDAAPQGWAAIDEWPALTHVFGGPAGEPPTSVTFEAGGESVTVHGISHAAREVTEGAVDRFPAQPGRGFHIGVLHAPVGPHTTTSVTDLQGRGMHYWALGGMPEHTVHHSGKPWVVHPGTIQGRSILPAQQGPKGAVLVTVDRGEASAPRLLELDLVRFTTATVDLSDLSTPAELIDRLQEVGDPGEHGGRSVVYRAVVRGSGPLHDDLLEPGRRAEVLAALRTSTGSVPFSWLDRLDWRTRPSLDIDEARQGTDFLSDLLATAEVPPGADDWRTGLPKLPTDIARFLDSPPDLADSAVAARALDLALNEFAGGQA